MNIEYNYKYMCMIKIVLYKYVYGTIEILKTNKK